MKKLFISVIIIAFPFLADAQLSGSGTYADPWSGTLEGDATWNGTKYINGDITVDNEKLTIGPGAIIIFLAEGADLIITGTGQFEALGTSESLIYFTADDNNNGIYGETGERRGHIVFWNMDVSAGSSKLEYSIVEFGDVSGSSNTTTFGGGIYLRSFSNITISNCRITNNKSTHGGGIMAQNYGTPSNPTLTNSTISQNIATSTGGGLYLHNECSSIITNCIINNNSAGYEGGGGIFLRTCTDVRVINSIIIKNTTTSATGGYNIQYFYISNSTNRPRFFNCIVWNANNSISHLPNEPAYSPKQLDFVNCAIRDVSTPASTYTSCIDLPAENDNTGPNFIDPDLPVTDWSIKFVSPCLDAGVSSYTGVTIPSTDYDANPRIGTKDIGTYEVQYSRWSGAISDQWTTTSNWEANLDPSSSTGDIIIPSGLPTYPTGSVSQNLTLGSGKQFIIEQGAKVTLNDLSNNGILKLKHNASGFTSLILNNYTRGTGATEEIQLYLTGGGDKTTYKWHYISTPVSSLPVSTFAPGTTQDVAQFVESRPTLSTREGWVAYDGYIYSTGGMGGPTFSDLTPGKGYDYWDNADNTFTFSGQLNTGDLAINLGFSGSATLHGFNLLGNPFSSGLNWNDIVNNVYFTYPSNTSKGLYFTRDNLQCSYISGVGIPSDVTGIIPPMQGFFTKTYSTGNTITLPAAARTHDDIHPRYKGSSIIPLIRLSLTGDSLTDETVVRFDEQAKADFDYD
ncbi:MAG: right-handed parallel beta-helix repeat-containing protein, partial [Bacteroidales bacterium]|nr:right-handed parallel beta-helix repeat-containing protein [Bacteroidales bacterium]